MATVVGKTSERIDQLLADLYNNAKIVDGRLILISRDGTEDDIGGVGNANSVTRLFYTAGAYPSRPSGANCVQWVGPTQPPSMTEKDDWMIVP